MKSLEYVMAVVAAVVLLKYAWGVVRFIRSMRGEDIL